jgi:hypothetical protein
VTTPPDGTLRHPPWSRRRRRTVRGLAAAVVLLGGGALVLPDGAGVTSGLLAAVAVLALIAALVVFTAVPGPGTARTLLRSPSLGGAVAVVSVLLVLSTQGTPLARMWDAVAVAAALWTGVALWRTRRPGRGDATRD